MSMNIFNPEENPDPQPGNIWGRKFTLISLVIVLLFAAMVYFRWLHLGKPSLREAPPTEQPNNPTTE